MQQVYHTADSVSWLKIQKNEELMVNKHKRYQLLHKKRIVYCVNIVYMSLLWLSGICLAILVILLILGESTLSLFGGNRDLAGQVYKSVFMLLGSGLVAGVVPTLFRIVVTFMDKQVLFVQNHHTLSNSIHAKFIPYWETFFRPLFELAAKYLPIFFIIAGIVMAIYIFFYG